MLLATKPIEKRSHVKGLIMAKIKIVGANSWKIGTASPHFAPSTVTMISLANKTHATVIGSVIVKTTA